MSDSNLAIWRSLEETDPRHVKEITGKTYKGNSPRPQYVIYRLTERFGPVGLGFGWEVLSDAYVDGAPHADGTEKTHECRIRFWWREGGDRCEVDSYGATKALYKAGTKGGQPGYWVSDEDAAKKSLTDAITKAASWLGVAADIFMGRWDDSKYVAALRQEARKEADPATSRPAGYATPGNDRSTATVEGAAVRSDARPLSQQAAPAGPREEHEPSPLELFIGKLNKATSLEDLQAIWSAHRDLQGNKGAIAAKDRNKGRLCQQPFEHDGRAA